MGVYTGPADFFDTFDKTVLFVIILAVALAVGFVIGRMTNKKDASRSIAERKTTPYFSVRLGDQEIKFKLDFSVPPEFADKVYCNDPVHANRLGRDIHAYAGKIIIGWEKRYCHVCISDPTVSRMHCEIYIEKGNLFLRQRGDTGTNPVLLNDKPGDAAQVHKGDRLKLGRVELTIDNIQEIRAGTDNLSEQRKIEEDAGAGKGSIDELETIRWK